jgi:hypothetical protein
MWFSIWTLICIEKLLFQLPSVRKQIWEDGCNRPDDVVSRPDALLFKASSQLKLNRPDVSQGSDARTIDIKIVCKRSTVQTAILLVWTRKALVRKLLAVDVRPSGRQCLTV